MNKNRKKKTFFYFPFLAGGSSFFASPFLGDGGGLAGETAVGPRGEAVLERKTFNSEASTSWGLSRIFVFTFFRWMSMLCSAILP